METVEISKEYLKRLVKALRSTRYPDTLNEQREFKEAYEHAEKLVYSYSVKKDA